MLGGLGLLYILKPLSQASVTMWQLDTPAVVYFIFEGFVSPLVFIVFIYSK